MDPRIGALSSGKLYAFAHGYNKPETIGALKQVESALGLRAKRIASPASPTRIPMGFRNFIATMTHGAETIDTVVCVKNADQAIGKAREFWNLDDGRSRQCNLLPRRCRAAEGEASTMPNSRHPAARQSQVLMAGLGANTDIQE